MIISDCFVSVLAPLRDDESIVEPFVRDVMEVLQSHFSNYELVLIDDGSRDETLKRLAALLREIDCVRVIQLSRGFGLEPAISAGLDSVIGDFVVVMQPRSDPPEMISRMVEASRQGSGVVTGVLLNRKFEPLWYRIGTRFFYLFCRLFLGLDLIENATDFRVLSRQAVNALTQINDKYRTLRVLSQWVGHNVTTMTYEPIQRGKQRPRKVIPSLARAVDFVVTNSVHPLRIVSITGLLASLLNLCYIGYVLVMFFIKKTSPEGWTTQSATTGVMFFLLFLCLAVLSEYLGRVLGETRDRPIYFVLDELNSSVMIADQNRRNIVEHPESREIQT